MEEISADYDRQTAGQFEICGSVIVTNAMKL